MAAAAMAEQDQAPIGPPGPTGNESDKSSNDSDSSSSSSSSVVLLPSLPASLSSLASPTPASSPTASLVNVAEGLVTCRSLESTGDGSLGCVLTSSSIAASSSTLRDRLPASSRPRSDSNPRAEPATASAELDGETTSKPPKAAWPMSNCSAAIVAGATGTTSAHLTDPIEDGNGTAMSPPPSFVATSAQRNTDTRSVSNNGSAVVGDIGASRCSPSTPLQPSDVAVSNRTRNSRQRGETATPEVAAAAVFSATTATSDGDDDWVEDAEAEMHIHTAKQTGSGSRIVDGSTLTTGTLSLPRIKRSSAAETLKTSCAPSGPRRLPADSARRGRRTRAKNSSGPPGSAINQTALLELMELMGSHGSEGVDAYQERGSRQNKAVSGSSKSQGAPPPSSDSKFEAFMDTMDSMLFWDDSEDDHFSDFEAGDIMRPGPRLFPPYLDGGYADRDQDLDGGDPLASDLILPPQFMLDDLGSENSGDKLDILRRGFPSDNDRRDNAGVCRSAKPTTAQSIVERLLKEFVGSCGVTSWQHYFLLKSEALMHLGEYQAAWVGCRVASQLAEGGNDDNNCRSSSLTSCLRRRNRGAPTRLLQRPTKPDREKLGASASSPKQVEDYSFVPRCKAIQLISAFYIGHRREAISCQNALFQMDYSTVERSLSPTLMQRVEATLELLSFVGSPALMQVKSGLNSGGKQKRN